MFNKSKTNNGNLPQDAAPESSVEDIQDDMEVEAEELLDQLLPSHLLQPLQPQEIA